MNYLPNIALSYGILAAGLIISFLGGPGAMKVIYPLTAGGGMGWLLYSSVTRPREQGFLESSAPLVLAFGFVSMAAGLGVAGILIFKGAGAGPIDIKALDYTPALYTLGEGFLLMAIGMGGSSALDYLEHAIFPNGGSGASAGGATGTAGNGGVHVDPDVQARIARAAEQLADGLENAASAVRPIPQTAREFQAVLDGTGQIVGSVKSFLGQGPGTP